MSAEAVDRRSEPRRHQRAFAGTVRSGPVRSTSEGPSTRCGSADVEGLETSGRHHFQAVDFEGGVKFSAQTRWARSKNRTIISNGSAEAGQTRPFQPSTGGGATVVSQDQRECDDERERLRKGQDDPTRTCDGEKRGWTTEGVVGRRKTRRGGGGGGGGGGKKRGNGKGKRGRQREEEREGERVRAGPRKRGN